MLHRTFLCIINKIKSMSKINEKSSIEFSLKPRSFNVKKRTKITFFHFRRKFFTGFEGIKKSSIYNCVALEMGFLLVYDMYIRIRTYDI
jgi:hypothetical protein